MGEHLLCKQGSPVRARHAPLDKKPCTCRPSPPSSPWGGPPDGSGFRRVGHPDVVKALLVVYDVCVAITVALIVLIVRVILAISGQ